MEKQKQKRNFLFNKKSSIKKPFMNLFSAKTHISQKYISHKSNIKYNIFLFSIKF